MIIVIERLTSTLLKIIIKEFWKIICTIYFLPLKSFQSKSFIPKISQSKLVYYFQYYSDICTIK